MSDIFKDMQEKVGCEYISDLPSYKRKVWQEMKRLNPADYEERQLEDFSNYVFGMSYQTLKDVMKQQKGREEQCRKQGCWWKREELPDYIVECLDEFISHYGTLEEVVEHKDDIYYYPDCETMTDVAYYYIDELQALGDIPLSLQNYIDYEAYGRDLELGGCFLETSRGMCEIPL